MKYSIIYSPHALMVMIFLSVKIKSIPPNKIKPITARVKDKILFFFIKRATYFCDIISTNSKIRIETKPTDANIK